MARTAIRRRLNWQLADVTALVDIRQATPGIDRTFEIEFLEPGAEAYCLTFG